MPIRSVPVTSRPGNLEVMTIWGGARWSFHNELLSAGNGGCVLQQGFNSQWTDSVHTHRDAAGISWDS
jgi:hypothetical protein